MNRLAAAALGIALAATPVRAAPSVQQYLNGYARVYVTGSDRVLYRFDVGAEIADGVGTAPSARVYLLVARCAPRCGAPVYYWAPLGPSQYDIRDEKRWWIALSAFGKPLRVTWQGAGDPGRPTDVVAAGYQAGVSSGWATTSDVTLLGRTCRSADAGAARSTTAEAETFTPSDERRITAKVPAGVPSRAVACRKAPA